MSSCPTCKGSGKIGKAPEGPKPLTAGEALDMLDKVKAQLDTRNAELEAAEKTASLAKEESNKELAKRTAKIAELTDAVKERDQRIEVLEAELKKATDAKPKRGPKK